MGYHKLALPEKRCPVCGLNFSWRKKWQLNWHSVVYCSERCRRSKSVNQNNTTVT